MKIIVLKSKKDVSEYVAKEVIKQVEMKPCSVLGLATGSTPYGAYQLLKEDYRTNNRDYSEVVTFNLDEYMDVEEDGPNSYRTYMENALFNVVNIPKDQRNFPLEHNAEQYDELIESKGGIDLQLLGIGINGHIAFNEPGSSFDSTTRIVELDASTRKRNAKYFSSLDAVPKQAVSMGIASIMKAKKIVLAATGQVKKDIINRLLKEDVTTDLPASILKTHKNLTIVLDKEAVEFYKYS